MSWLRVPTCKTETVTANTVEHRWAMKDIPAFGFEKCLDTPRNYIDKIDFQLLINL